MNVANMKRRIVVMGGSFNPPTIAHLRLMHAAMDGVRADEGIFVPSSHAYVKRKMRRSGHPNDVYSELLRLEMLRAMCAEDSRLKVDEVEYKRENGKNFETMEYLQQKHPSAELYFLLGGDKLEVFPRWHRGQEFMERFKLIVFRRNGMDPEAQILENRLMREYRDSFVILPRPEGVDGISSTVVRERLRNGEDVRELMDKGAWEIVMNKEAVEINRFREQYDFLSNFYPSPVKWEGLTYPNSEAAFQAAKVLNDDERQPFTTLEASAAKRMGRRVRLRDDWEQVKTGIMEEIVQAKFTQNRQLGARLVATGRAQLIEGNTWGDTCWGVDMRTGKGENRLGEILMRVRAELMDNHQ